MSSGFRFLHFGDTHIGRKQPSRISKKRVRSSLEAFDHVVKQAIEEDVDFVVHTGDFFDTVYPWHSAAGSAEEKLRKLEKHEIPVYAIRGNHDRSYGQGRKLKGLAFDNFTLENFHVIDPSFGEFPEYMQFNEDIRIYGLGYHADKTPGALKDFEPGFDGFSVLLLQDFVEGLTRTFEGEHTSVDALARKDLDYIAVGHDHDPQQSVTEQNGTVFSATGGTIDFDFNVSEAKKTFNIVHVEEDGSIERVQREDIPQTLSLKMVDVDAERANPENLVDILREQEFEQLAVKIRVTGEAKPGEIPSQRIAEELERLDGVVMTEVLLSTTAEIENSTGDTQRFDLLEHLERNMGVKEFEQIRDLHRYTTSLVEDDTKLTAKQNLRKDAREELRAKAKEILYED
jgi:DNA repair exonuclease